jgi:hypothetical protein
MAAKIKGEAPHRSGVDAEKQGKQVGQEVGKKVDDAVSFPFPTPPCLTCSFFSSTLFYPIDNTKHPIGDD